jgi:hypothetical protein
MVATTTKGLRDSGFIPSTHDFEPKHLGRTSELLGMGNNSPNTQRKSIKKYTEDSEEPVQDKKVIKKTFVEAMNILK